MSTDISMTASKDQDIDIESMYQSISPKGPESPSVAQWLEPAFSHHKSKYL